MRVTHEGTKYVPATHPVPHKNAAELASNYIREWDEKRLEKKGKAVESIYPPTICISRKLGGGAVVIAEILAKKIGYKVVDQEIMEFIATQAKLSEKTVAIFDERYPGKLSEFLSLAFGEKAFIKCDYTRHMFSAVFAIAALGPTIFVGRGAHLLLARDRILAVRIICSREYRIKRLSQILNIDEGAAASKLDHIDRQQRAFFKSVYGKKDASPYEFDLVINCDYIRDPQWAADIIKSAFERKFSSEL